MEFNHYNSFLRRALTTRYAHPMRQYWRVNSLRMRHEPHPARHYRQRDAHYAYCTAYHLSTLTLLLLLMMSPQPRLLQINRKLLPRPGPHLRGVLARFLPFFPTRDIVSFFLRRLVFDATTTRVPRQLIIFLLPNLVLPP